MNKETAEKKLFYLDGIRGLAALAVVISHCVKWMTATKIRTSHDGFTM
ncbi:hypothetical protein [Paenibacillus sp. Leaf72]|nr:hypothetical protein [Paenibacillus sp. Leaf72]